MRNPLDHPIWNALTTRQASFGMGTARALRYRPDIAPFFAVREDGTEALRDVITLVEPDDVLITLQAFRCPIPPGMTQVSEAIGVQMMGPSTTRALADGRIEPLGADDAADMISLAELTKPGPFRARTHELGRFWGVRDGGKLVAMAGERMNLQGFTEISGVCTHPDARGKGYARSLSMYVARQIAERGDIPFLHAYADNRPAIRLYESLGFTIRCEMQVQVFSK